MSVKEQILQGAQKLFQSKGLGSITMEEVAQSIGKGKSSLYYYFKSKEDLFMAVMQMEIDEAILETSHRIAMCGTFTEKLRTFASVKLEMALKRRWLYRTMESIMDVEEIKMYKDIKKTVHVEYVQKEKIILLQVFLEAMAGGRIAKIDDSELDTAIMVFLSALRGINREAVVHGHTELSMKMIHFHCTAFCKGLQ